MRIPLTLMPGQEGAEHHGRARAIISLTVTMFFVLLALALFSARAEAAITLSSPGPGTRVTEAQDFASDTFYDPWDMSHAPDVNYGYL